MRRKGCVVKPGTDQPDPEYASTEAGGADDEPGAQRHRDDQPKGELREDDLPAPRGAPGAVHVNGREPPDIHPRMISRLVLREGGLGQATFAANGPPSPKASRAKLSAMRRCPAGSGWISSGSGSSA